MNALEKIKTGILENNIELIAEGYEDMTGEKLLKATVIKKSRKKSVAKKVDTINDSIIMKDGFYINKKRALARDQVIPKVQFNDFDEEQYKKDRTSKVTKERRPPTQFVEISCKNPRCRKIEKVSESYLNKDGEGFCATCRESKIV